MDTRVPEPAEDVAARQSGQIAEAAKPEPGEQVDQFRLRLTQRLQPADRQPGTEAGGVAGGDEQRSRCWRIASRAAMLDANRPSAMPMPALPAVAFDVATADRSTRRDANIASPPK